MSSDDNPRASAEFDELIGEVGLRRDALSAAERNLDQIPDLLAKAEKARKAKKRGSKERREALEAQAQTIRDRLRDARLDLQEEIRKLPVRVSRFAIETEPGRALLGRFERLSPYPSVEVGDQALLLLEALAEIKPRGAPSFPKPPRALWARLESLPEREPSWEDRRVMAELLSEAMAIRKDSRKSAWAAIGISEHTLESLLYPERVKRDVRRSTWEKAVAFVKEALVQAGTPAKD